MNIRFSGKRKIDGITFHDAGYWGAAAVAKQEYYQKQGSKTRIIRIGGKKSSIAGTRVLMVAGGRKRRK